MLSRLAENLSFGITSSLALLFRRRPDVIYANTWPVLAAGMIAIVARLRRIPIVFFLQDIYPESLDAQGRPGGRVVRRVLLTLDRWIVRGAAAVVVISERFAEHYRRTRSVESSRIHVVPNWLSSEGTEEISGVAEECRDRNGIPRDAFLLTYGGNIGVAAAVETVIEAFRHLGDVPDLRLLIAGDGASLGECLRLAAEIAPSRIYFQNPWIDTMSVLHAAQAVVLPTRAEQSMASVPSKLISYLLAGRPVVAATLGGAETAAVIQASGSGVVVDPEDPKALAAAFRAMAQRSREERLRMGLAGRAWALANMTTDACLPRLISIVEGASR